MNLNYTKKFKNVKHKEILDHLRKQHEYIPFKALRYNGPPKSKNLD